MDNDDLLNWIHLVNGSPVYPDRQTHIGLWLITWHSVLSPQVPGHGSTHFWFTHAWFRGHSELITHSGLQLGGIPIKPGTQLHTDWEFTTLQILFGPQGEGRQRFFSTGSKIWYFNICTYATSFNIYFHKVCNLRMHFLQIRRDKNT